MALVEPDCGGDRLYCGNISGRGAAVAHFLVRLDKAQPELMTPILVKDHVAWLRERSEAGELILCCPCEDGSAILVIECATQEEAELIAATDPFAKADAYAARSVVGFRLAPPENNFLLS